jgi:hypothetical protein
MNAMPSPAPAPGLPQFLVIGAVKAATTWIAHQLRQHPDIFMPGPEPHYFSTEYDRGLDWYREWFAEAPPGKVLGEKSADLLAYKEAPARIAALLPDVPMVLQLRNPMERAYSDYCMLYRRGTVTEDPAYYLAKRADEQPRFLEDGLYARHLGRFLDHFPKEQIKVFLHDDIKSQPETVIAEVCRHIGVPVHIAADEVRARKNDSEAPLLPLSIRKLLAPAKPLVQPLRDTGWFRMLRSGLAQPVRYPPLTDELYSRLRDYYREDVERLSSMIDRDLTAWLTATPKRAKAEAST